MYGSQQKFIANSNVYCSAHGEMHKQRVAGHRNVIYNFNKKITLLKVWHIFWELESEVKQMNKKEKKNRAEE